MTKEIEDMTDDEFFAAMNTGDVLQGMRDCDRGIPHQSGMSADYDRGYASQYEFEQIKSAMGVN